MFKPCPPGLRYTTEWFSEKKVWKKIPLLYQNMLEQVNRRCHNGEFEQREDRGEFEPDFVKKNKLIQGLTAEHMAYYYLNNVCPGYLYEPRDEGASWCPDLYSKCGQRFEVKCIRVN